MIKLNIKPLSVNQAWKGRRFKADKYKKYEADMLYILPTMEIPKGFIHLDLEFGFSSAASDIDNPVKPFIDCLQKRYKFNDKMIKKLTVTAIKTTKGSEYIKFDIFELAA